MNGVPFFAVAGTILAEEKMSDNTGNLASGTPTTPTFGSMVANG